ncbi:MAG: hypothetical protein H7336_02390 [Bacteriovorax sp.]|nr:hypothetical protein [Bacteriovorax sp.]
MKPGDKASKEAFQEKLKVKQDASNKEEDKFRLNLKENIFKRKTKNSAILWMSD